jgi:hypothetical protein
MVKSLGGETGGSIMLFEETLPAGTETIFDLCWLAGTATNWIGRVRQKIGIIDRPDDPNHSCRHPFLSASLRLGAP